MKPWKKKVNGFKNILKKHDDDTDESAVKCAKELAIFMKSKPIIFKDTDDNYGETIEEMIEHLEYAETQKEVNGILSDIYDWADIARVWLE
jgi:MarR-like DNA-binding transcriptional regulator SgrR of sgrS sRNA